jgi:pyruvate kinase
MNVARVNFSHGAHAEHGVVIENVRRVAERLQRPIAILQDLSGPKIRLGVFEAFWLKRGQEVVFAPEIEQNSQKNVSLLEEKPSHRENLILPLPVPELLAALKPHCLLLIDDGKLSLRVTHCEGEPYQPNRRIVARCIVGGELKPRKGVTAPGVDLNLSGVTPKDERDFRFGLEQGVDWVAVSYVRTKSDFEPLLRIMEEVGKRVPLIAKIEKQEAVENLSEILEIVDGVMVARGDMGVEMPFDQVPLVQKEIIRLCNRVGKPVITATQMLESMIQNPRPTRAEATDVANAILDGTDAVMLSGETAAGEFPLQAVRTMARIAQTAEKAFFQDQDFDTRLKLEKSATNAVAHAAVVLAEQIRANAILCATTSGGTARAVAQHRPSVPILGVTTEIATYRQLALTWGVTPAFIDPVENTDAMIESTLLAAQAQGFVKRGNRVVITAGVPVNNPGTTNMIQVRTI